jgi:iron(III) transport system ATP-binding protein
MIAGLEKQHAGDILINGKMVAGSETCLPPHKRGIGFVFQDSALWPHLTVEKHLTFARSTTGKGDWHAYLLNLTDLKDRAQDYPSALSGGERQRLSIARALSFKPALLLFDEPLRHLDRNLALELRQAIVDILEETGTTSIFVTHDQEEALSMAHRILLFGEGGPVQTGPPEELFGRPVNPWAAEFFGPVNRFKTRSGPDGEVNTPLGRFPSGLAPGTDCELILRASQIGVNRSGQGVPARVRRRVYHGDKVLLICEAGRARLKALSADPSPKRGEEVYLQAGGEPMIFNMQG